MKVTDRAGLAARPLGVAVPGVVVVLLPKCPACAGAYLAFLSGLGLQLPPGPLLAGTVAVLAAALALLGRAAFRRGRWGAFAVAVVGGLAVLAARAADAPALWSWAGVVLLYAGALRIYLGRLVQTVEHHGSCH